MVLADDISQALAEQPAPKQLIFPGVINSVDPLTVTLDGSGVALPCLYFGGVTLKVSRRVGVILVGSDLVVFGSFGDDLVFKQAEITGALVWGGSTTVTSGYAPSSTPGNTTYGSWPGTQYGVVFVAPPSGKMMLTWSARINMLAAFGVGAVSVDVRQGNTLGSGTIVLSPSDTYAINFSGSISGEFYTSTMHRILTGLVPGNSYSAELVRYASPASSANINFANLTASPQI